ncbi:MAG: HyaD/HybD family hydrogenase maturation endopeptidase [Thermodesulfobacteriota bacterium]
MMTEPLDNNEKKLTGILGTGNLLLGDEGFGVHVVHHMEKNYLFPEEVKVIDCGTAGIYMAPFLEECDPIYVVDVVAVEGEPGSIHHFHIDEIRSGTISSKMSPHQLGLVEMLDICRLRDVGPESVEFFCVVPEQLDTGVTLSPVVEARVSQVADQLVARLEDDGLSVKKRQE